jgi:biotin carboxylase
MMENYQTNKPTESKKHILILGGGVMQLPALRIARRKGWRVILADGNKQAPGIPLADNFEHVDLKDKEQMARTALRYKDKNELDGVFTAGTDFSATVAWVAEKCRLPGIPYQVALTASDKSLMRRALKAHSVPCPAFVALQAGDDPARYLDLFPFPVVLKPTDNMGSRGVRRVDTPQDLAQAFALALQSSRSGKVIMEAYMPGPELSVDALVADGEIHITGIADRHIFFPPYFVELGHTMPSMLDEKLLNQAMQVFQDGIRAIGIDKGAAKGDIKLTPQGPMIGEIAARLSGGYMSGWTYPYASGVEITEAAMQIAVGLPLGDLTPRYRKVSAERAFISIPGTVVEVAGSEEIKQVAGIKEFFLRAAPGDKVVFPTNNVEKGGNIITQAETREEAIRLAEQGIQTVLLRLKADEPGTNRFLFRDEVVKETGGFYESTDFFQLASAANRQALQAMPLYLHHPGLNPAGLNPENDLYIQPLPELTSEPGTDWHGMGFQAALRKVCQYTNVMLPASPLSPQAGEVTARQLGLGRLFWLAFLRGGAQGGIYLIDTIRQHLKRQKELWTD